MATDHANPCPFCGRDDKLEVLNESFCNIPCYAVMCTKCVAKGPTGRTAKEAIELWRTRHHAGQAVQEEG